MGGYEEHQKLRTKAVRLCKKKAYADAIKTLYAGAESLLKQKEQGSGCDLALYMIEIYGIAETPVNDESRGQVTSLLELAQPDFWRKKVFDAAAKWTAKATGNSAGDAQLRLFIGQLLAKEGSYHPSEAHFISACAPSPHSASTSGMPSSTFTSETAPNALAQMMSDWLAAHAQQGAQEPGESRDVTALERIEAGRFALRGMVPLLLSRALTGAQTFLRQYITLVTKRHSTLLLPVTPNPRPYVPPGTTSPPAGQESQQLYLTANPDLNFAQMALALTVQAVSAQKSGARVPDTLKNAWMALVRQYEREGAALEQDESVREAIPALSKIYFHIQPPRSQGNMLQEMMANLFGGPPGGSGSTDDAQVVLPRQAPPPARLQAPSPAAETAGEPEEEDLD